MRKETCVVIVSQSLKNVQFVKLMLVSGQEAKLFLCEIYSLMWTGAENETWTIVTDRENAKLESLINQVKQRGLTYLFTCSTGA